ncbi:MAG: serine/threonine-protein kinase [Marinilabiliaceae bacterium]|nr:serine/threonine-protein kinase [Marinilabiliaceae bacterium]
MSQLLFLNQFKSSQLYSSFNSNISSIELPNDPVNEGGAFGKVYKCTVCGIVQAVKVFCASDKSKDAKGYETICKLQDEIIAFNIKLKSEGKKLEDINALWALPLFSFKGKLDNKEVMGYSTHFLSAEWMSFDDMFSTEKTEKERLKLQETFYRLSSESRVKFIYDLLEGFVALERMKFIYADLNPKNFYINIQARKLCLIDYDSGGVNEEPETIGKPGAWQAPEIANGERYTANLLTDYWSVAMAVHYFYFPYEPFFYLSGQSKKLMQEYFANNQYPEINEKDRNFNKDETIRYNNYISILNRLPQKIVKAFKQSFQNGYFSINSGARITSQQWFKLIDPLLPTSARQRQPNPIITVISNNTTLGTVSVSGNVITTTLNYSIGYATPAYEVTRGSAKVSQNGNKFTVMATADCEIRINFEKQISPPIIITSISNNPTLGTVSISGNVIIATPNYRVNYASPAYEITNGIATVWQTGNTFIVTATTDCEIRINFIKEKRQSLFLAAIAALCLIIVAFFVAKSLYFSDGSTKEEKTEIIESSFDPQMLIGAYRAKYQIDGELSCEIMTANIDLISQNEYQLTINSDYGPVTFRFTCVGKTITAPDIPEIKLDINNHQIQITFKKDNQLWEFTKVLVR